ncbi:MAG TPA: hypothetical protein VJ021_05670 [Thermoplasmata archaeon]|nr:hypothetical protein [Thermoplasmata archaeon]
MQSSSSRDSDMRRSRVPCKVCGRPVELVRMRDHLRSEHQVASADLETMYLDARIEARRSRRSQRP